MIEKTAKGSDLQRGERLQVMLENAELKAVDDFRFENRMPSRAAAIRELLRRGLAAIGYDMATSTDSSAFGVINSPSSGSDEGSAA